MTTFCTCCGRDIQSPKMLRFDTRIDSFHSMQIPAEHAGRLAPFGSRCAPRISAEAKEALYAYRCREAGALAFNAGLPSTANPYTLGMGAGVRWLEGYEAAAKMAAEQVVRAARLRARLNPHLPFPA